MSAMAMSPTAPPCQSCGDTCLLSGLPAWGQAVDTQPQPALPPSPSPAAPTAHGHPRAHQMHTVYCTLGSRLLSCLGGLPLLRLVPPTIK